MKRNEVKRLTNEWYAKLKREGFEDIEFYDPQTGLGQSSRYTKDSSTYLSRKYSQTTETHYRLMQNFLAHYPILTKKDKYILQMYTNGSTFRYILKKLRKKGKGYGYDHYGKLNISLSSLHRMLKYYIKLAYKWNQTNDEGLLNPDYTHQHDAANAD